MSPKIFNRMVMVNLTPQALDLIDDARGCLTVEAFVERAALAAAQRLVETTAPEDRRGAVVPKFELDNQPTTC